MHCCIIDALFYTITAAYLRHNGAGNLQSLLAAERYLLSNKLCERHAPCQITSHMWCIVPVFLSGVSASHVGMKHLMLPKSPSCTKVFAHDSNMWSGIPG